MEAANSLILPRSAYQVLRRLTGASRPEVALSLALKELARFRLEAAESKIREFEARHGMDFVSFADAWKSGEIEHSHSYGVEKDYWEWEAATTDLTALRELVQWLV